MLLLLFYYGNYIVKTMVDRSHLNIVKENVTEYE